MPTSTFYTKVTCVCTNLVKIRNWRNMLFTTSFQGENSSHLLSEHEASGQHQFLIGSIFVLDYQVAHLLLKMSRSYGTVWNIHAAC